MNSDQTLPYKTVIGSGFRVLIIGGGLINHRGKGLKMIKAGWITVDAAIMLVCRMLERLKI